MLYDCMGAFALFEEPQRGEFVIRSDLTAGHLQHSDKGRKNDQCPGGGGVA